jgi:hypothetical protein
MDKIGVATSSQSVSSSSSSLSGEEDIAMGTLHEAQTPVGQCTLQAATNWCVGHKTEIIFLATATVLTIPPIVYGVHVGMSENSVMRGFFSMMKVTSIEGAATAVFFGALYCRSKLMLGLKR